ncbi:MAG: hypothetical protein IPO63_04840 [Bacteroidetes bacterium]|nr:hypothetical protein [Bacteroidota bacterium]
MTSIIYLYNKFHNIRRFGSNFDLLIGLTSLLIYKRAILRILLALLLSNSQTVFSQNTIPCDESKGTQSTTQGSPNDSISGPDDGISLSFQIVVPISRDPNEIWGPTGYEDERFVAKANPLGYTILFENDPEFATAPAQLVHITYPIHFNQNISSFHLGDFSLNNNTFTIPYNSTSYSARLDMRDSIGVYVDVTAGIDITNQRAFWILKQLIPPLEFVRLTL